MLLTRSESPADVQSAATTYFNALFSRPDVKNVTVTAHYSSIDGSQIVLEGNVTLNTNFLGVLGIGQIDMSASTTSVWGNTDCGLRSCSTIPVLWRATTR